MSALPQFFCFEKFSYQHIQGLMLLNFNKLASELHLSHSEYRVMGIIIGLWNKERGMAFPTVEYLAKYCNMGKQTVLKSLKKLVELNLLMVERSRSNRNNYYPADCLFNQHKTTLIPKDSIACNTRHDKELKRNITKKKSLLPNEPLNIADFNIDDAKSNISLENNTNLIKKQLQEWYFSNPDKIIEKYSTEKITIAINMVKQKKPQNPGAYLRTILNLEILKLKEDNGYKKEDKQIYQYIKYKYWKHVPTGKTYQVLPDCGNHLLIKYNSEENSIFFIELNFTDKLSNFIPLDNVYSIQKREDYIKRPDKELIISTLTAEGKLEEVMILKKLLRIK